MSAKRSRKSQPTQGISATEGGVIKEVEQSHYSGHKVVAQTANFYGPSKASPNIQPVSTPPAAGWQLADGCHVVGPS